MYTVETINRNLPINLATGSIRQHTFFWRKGPFLSHFYHSMFIVNEITYFIIEHFVKSEGATQFKDREAYYAIMTSEDPAFMKGCN